MIHEKRDPGAPLEGATGAGDEAGGFGWHDTANLADRQAVRLLRLHPVSEAVARTLAGLAFGGGGA